MSTKTTLYGRQLQRLELAIEALPYFLVWMLRTEMGLKELRGRPTLQNKSNLRSVAEDVVLLAVCGEDLKAEGMKNLFAIQDWARNRVDLLSWNVLKMFTEPLYLTHSNLVEHAEPAEWGIAANRAPFPLQNVIAAQVFVKINFTTWR